MLFFFIILPLPALWIIAIILAVRDGNNNHMNNKQNAKYAFYYLLSLAALIFMALSVGMILFTIIDKTIPDALNFGSGNSDGMLKFAISALLISAPIYYLIFGLINRGLKKEEIAKDSGVRRWLTYFTLLVSALIILGVFIGVINTFLSGSLSSQFILKSVAVFLISAIVFSFYFYDIKREEVVKKDLALKIFFWATFAIVAAVFIASWFFVESPKIARERRLDQILSNNISGLESAMNTYYIDNKKLPETLDALKTDKNIYLPASSLLDPETKSLIVYEKLTDQTFQLCATFRLDSAQDNYNGSYNGSMMVSYPASATNHAAGYQCLAGTLYAVPGLQAPLKI